MRLVHRSQGATNSQAAASLGSELQPVPSLCHRNIMRRIASRHRGGQDYAAEHDTDQNLHVGRLPPPKGWEDMPARLASGQLTDSAVIVAQVTPAIAETVRRQVQAGIDCVGDGEFWTARTLDHYTAHFTGVETRPIAPGEPPTTRHSTRERDEFPDFYADMDNAGTLFLVPGEKPMPPVTVRVVASSPAIEGTGSHQSPARHLQGRD